MHGCTVGVLHKTHGVFPIISVQYDVFLLVASRHSVSVGFLLCREVGSQTGVSTAFGAVGIFSR